LPAVRTDGPADRLVGGVALHRAVGSAQPATLELTRSSQRVGPIGSFHRSYLGGGGADLASLNLGEVLRVDDGQHRLDLARLGDRLRRGPCASSVGGEPGPALALLALGPVKAILLVDAAAAAGEAAGLLAGLVGRVAL
jgi:hypothetical protein